MQSISHKIINDFKNILYNEDIHIDTRLSNIKTFIEEYAKLGLIEWKVNKFMGRLYCKSDVNNKKHYILYTFIRPTSTSHPHNYIPISDFICHFVNFSYNNYQYTDTKIYFKHIYNNETVYIPIMVTFPSNQIK
jgi:hypothetical protein